MTGPFGPPIEGETPLESTEGLKDLTIQTRAALSVAEAENIRKATIAHLASRPSARTAPFDFGWMLKLHADMFGGVWEWAGQCRTKELTIGVDPRNVPEQLGQLALNQLYWPTDEPHWVEMSARLHHEAVRIHPFVNGNGRWARMLSNIWLARHGANVVWWPDAEVAGESRIRSDYMAALKQADRGVRGPLESLHREYLGPL